MKKKVLLQFFLISIVIISIFIFFNNYMSKDHNLVSTDIKINQVEESNKIEGIQYFSKDVNGNIYILKAENGLMINQQVDEKN